MMLLPRLMSSNFSSVREFLIKYIFYGQIHQAQNYFSREKIYYSFEHFPGVYMYFWISGCPSMQQSGLSFSLFCVPLYDLLFIPCPLLPLHLESTLLVAKDLFSYFSVSRGMRLWKTDLQNCPNHSWLSVSQYPYFVCVYTSRIRVYTRDSPSRSTSGVRTCFFPGSHLRVSQTPQVARLIEEFLSHRHAVLRDKTACASFHLEKKSGEKRSFRSFHWNQYVYQVVILHRIPSFPCNINTSEFLSSDTSALVTLKQRFPVCMFAFPNSCQCVRPHMIWTWCRLNFHQSSPEIVIPFQKSLTQARALNFSVQYDGDEWNSFRASAWAQNSSLIPSSSFVSSSWNSSLSPWDSPLRFSLLTVDSRLRVGSGNS